MISSQHSDRELSDLWEKNFHVPYAQHHTVCIVHLSGRTKLFWLGRNKISTQNGFCRRMWISGGELLFGDIIEHLARHGNFHRVSTCWNCRRNMAVTEAGFWSLPALVVDREMVELRPRGFD
ncbi:hypothetical protein MLD38_009539 [Melastoma candidum]|uniref:Uncharacterized protein n=1 Tax=Melastoma candidum TaxID=119954 RepID=A0ACB9RYF3_9MYRT|nr:hypothetical protein MLD38_009539 [Melastoma candidum]